MEFLQKVYAIQVLSKGLHIDLLTQSTKMDCPSPLWLTS